MPKPEDFCDAIAVLGISKGRTFSLYVAPIHSLTASAVVDAPRPALGGTRESRILMKSKLFDYPRSSSIVSVRSENSDQNWVEDAKSSVSGGSGMMIPLAAIRALIVR